MAYITEAELEGITTLTFDADSPITTTQMTELIAQMSSKLDAVCAVDEANFGSATTCPEWVKQAVLSACTMVVENIYYDAGHTELQILRVLNEFAKKRKSSTDTLPKFSRRSPDSSGNI